MNNLSVVILAFGAFWLGACPFSLLIGKALLHKDVRDYGDGNPGAVNVFLAGGGRVGTLALLLDIGKGLPFVYAAHSIFDLSEPAVLAVGICAILGHAFSPFLGFHGGKAVAITYGVLLVLPNLESLLALAICTLLGFILLDNDAWTVEAGALAAFGFMVFSQGNTWNTRFMLFVLLLFTFKFFRELRTVPQAGRLVNWIRARR